MRVGIFGGSFNPLHDGHLHLARRAFSELNLSRVVFVPAWHSPLKSPSVLLPAALRVRLIRRALKGRPFFSVSTVELRRKGCSYTVDTLRYFKRHLGRRVTLYFLAGADVLRALHRWKSLPEILKLCRFVILARSGYRVSRLPREVIYLPVDTLPLSSTAIRQRFTRAKGDRTSKPKKK